ncbi:peptidyl-prolyl cis-trans isomerase D [Brevundimonas alba]|uniref:Parvulin-like PPIase n=1 Tax=Brevundimonas alba TaxID=74314 RepID=A0A7X5YN50_9CAUL|nr:peptidyl-prolyl cis-trans isomerase [Brevundimonas alba]NJC42271.1 peptidyl-prolyl cis-trans isomerase D [Brevundimonas alba]
MISLFRNFAKSKWAMGLLVLVALGLLVTGGSQTDILGSLQAPKVISAGDRGMSPQEFRATMDRQLEQIQQQQGRAITYEEAFAQTDLGGVLRSQSQELGFFAWAWKAGIRPGNELILRQIRAIPAFFDPVTNQFSETLYQSKLAEVKMTPELLEREARDGYSRAHYGTALVAGLRAPRIYGAVYASLNQQARDGRWFVLTQQMAGTAPAPTDAQLNSFMSQNAARLRVPELRSGSLIVFSNPADQNIAIGEDKIQARFEFRKDALSLPERRTFTTLTAPSLAAAERIAAALRAGQTPAAVGQANNLRPADFADTPRSAVSDPAVAGAVFGLGLNEVSAPVQARVGFVVARVTSITPGREVTLADVRDQIVQELKGQEMRGAIARRVEAYDAARRAGKSVDEAARQVGAQIVPIPAVTREGRNRQSQQLNVPAQVLEGMWKLTKGRASEPTALGEGQYFVVRVDEVFPAAMPALNTVRDTVTRAWIARENVRLLTAKSDAVMARLRGGEDIAAVAASVGATLTTRTGLKQDQQTVAQVGEAVIGGLFNTNPGQVFDQPQEGGIVVGRVDRVTAPTAALAADEAQQWRARLGAATGDPLFATAATAAADRMKATYDEALARQALGLPEAPAAPARPAGQ